MSFLWGWQQSIKTNLKAHHTQTTSKQENGTCGCGAGAADLEVTLTAMLRELEDAASLDP